MGVKVTGLYWTLGAFDSVAIFEALDEATTTALMMQVASLGNVRTQTARAFDAAEIRMVLGMLPK